MATYKQQINAYLKRMRSSYSANVGNLGELDPSLLNAENQLSIKNTKLINDIDKKVEKNWWQKFTDAWDTITSNIGKGVLNWADSIGDLIMGGIGAVASWNGNTELENKMKYAINYDWQTPTNEYLKKIDATRLLNPRTYTKEYWTSTWKPEDTRNEFTTRKYNNFVSQKTADVLAQVGEGIGEVIPDVILAIFTGGGWAAAKGATTAASAASKTSKAVKVARIALKTAQGMGKGFATVAREDGSLGTGAGYAAIQGAIAGATTYLATEKLGVGSLANKWQAKGATKLVETLASKGANALTQNIVGYGVTALTDFGFNFATSMIRGALDPVFKNITYNPNAIHEAYGDKERATATLKQLALSSVISATTSTVTGALRSIIVPSQRVNYADPKQRETLINSYERSNKKIEKISKRIAASKEAREQIQKAANEQEKINAESIKLDNVTRFVESTIERANELGNVPKEAMENLMNIYSDYVEDHTNKQIDYTNNLFKKLAEFEIETDRIYRVDEDLRQASLAAEVYNPYKSIRANIESADHPSHYRHIEVDGIKVNGRIDKDGVLNLKTTKNNIALSAEQTQSILFLMEKSPDRIVANLRGEDLGVFEKGFNDKIIIDNSEISNTEAGLLADLTSGVYYAKKGYENGNRDVILVGYYDDKDNLVGGVTIDHGKIISVEPLSKETRESFNSKIVINRPSDEKLSVGEEFTKNLTARAIKQNGRFYISKDKSRTFVKDILQESFSEDNINNKAFADGIDNFMEQVQSKANQSLIVELKRQLLENYDKVVLSQDGKEINIKDTFASIEDYNAHKEQLNSLLTEIENGATELSEYLFVPSHDFKALTNNLKGFNEAIDQFTASFSMDNDKDMENSLQRLAEKVLSLKTNDGKVYKETLKDADKWTTDFKARVKEVFTANSKLAEKGVLEKKLNKLDYQVKSLQNELSKTKTNFYIANKNLKTVDGFKKFRDDARANDKNLKSNRYSEIGKHLLDLSFDKAPINKHGQFKNTFAIQVHKLLKNIDNKFVNNYLDVDLHNEIVNDLDTIVKKGNKYLSVVDSGIVSDTLNYIKREYNAIATNEISKLRQTGADAFVELRAIKGHINTKNNLLKNAMGDWHLLEQVVGRSSKTKKILLQDPDNDLNNQLILSEAQERTIKQLKKDYDINKYYLSGNMKIKDKYGNSHHLAKDQAVLIYFNSLAPDNLDALLKIGIYVNNKDMDVDYDVLADIKSKIPENERLFLERVRDDVFNGDMRKATDDYSTSHFGFSVTLEKDKKYITLLRHFDTVGTEVVNPIASFGTNRLKARVDNNHRVLITGFDSFLNNQIKDVSQIVTMDNIRNLQRLLNMKYTDFNTGQKMSLKEALSDVFTNEVKTDLGATTIKQGNNFVDELLDRIFLKSDPNQFESKFFANATAVPITANVGTIFKQYLDLTRMTRDVGYKNYFKGIARGLFSVFNRSERKRITALLSEKSAAYIRTSDENTPIRQNVLNAKVASWIQKLNRPLEAANKHMYRLAFSTMQEWAQSDGYGKIGTPENDAKALELLDTYASRFFSNNNRLDMSAIRYGERGILQKYLFGTYQADAQKVLERLDDAIRGNPRSKKRVKAYNKYLEDANTTLDNLNTELKQLETDSSPEARARINEINEMIEAHEASKENINNNIQKEIEYQKTGFRRVSNVVATMATTAILEAAISHFNNYLRGKKEIKEVDEETIKDIGYNFALSWIPYINIISNAAMNNQKQFSIVQLQGLTKVLNSITEIKDVASNKSSNWKSYVSPSKKVISAIGYYFGVPVDNLIGYIEGTMKNISAETGSGTGYKFESILDGYNTQYLEKETKKYLEMGEVNRAIASNRANMAFFKTGNVDYKLAKELTVKEVRIRPQPLGEYNNRQIEIFNSYYTKANQQASRMLISKAYLKADDELKSKMLTNLYKAYYEYALYIIDQEKEPSSKIAKLLVKKATKGTLTAEERLYLQSVGVL